jgi:hypothetical protein
VSITIRGLSGCVSSTYSMRVVITASGATGQSAEATWWTEGFPQTSFAASPTEPNTYEVRLSGIPGNRLINVVGSVTSTGGKRGFSGVSQVSRSCGGRR